MTKYGKMWQNVAKCGKILQNVAKCGKLKIWQNMAKCGGAPGDPQPTCAADWVGHGRAFEIAQHIKKITKNEYFCKVFPNGHIFRPA